MTNILLNILEKTTNFTSQTYKALINNAYNKMKCKSFLVRFHYNKTESHMGVLNKEVGKSRFQTTIFIAPNDSP